MDEAEIFNQQIEGQKELVKTQADEAVKPYLPTMQQQMSEAQAVVIEQLNPRRVVKDVLLELAGLEENEDGGEAPKKIGDPLMNKYGLAMVRTLMRGVINQNTIFTFLDKKEIERLMLKLSDDTSINIGLNWREYGVRNRTDCDIVMNIILFNTFAALKRAQDANEKKFHRSIAFESIGAQQRQKKDQGMVASFMSKIKL